MKKTVFVTALSALAGILLLPCCNLPSLREHFDKDEGKKVLAKAKFDRVLIDSTGELQVYASMNRSEELKNKEAILRFADPYKELYLLVFKEDVAGFKTVIENNADLYKRYKKDTASMLDIYSDITTGAMSKNLDSGKDSLLVAKTLHDMNYRAYAITGTYKKISLFYLKGIYKSSRNYYQVVVWTLASRRNLYEGIMKKMIESLQEESGLQ